MKTTTYTIGKQGLGAPNEKKTSHGLVFTKPDGNEIFTAEGYDKNSRRCDPANPNR